MPKIAILASGSGTTAQAALQATTDGRLDAEIALIIHNNPSAGVKDLPEVAEQNVNTICINGKTHPGEAEKGSMTDAESQAVLDAVNDAGCDLVALLGYMKRVRGALLEELGYQEDRPARIANTHPGPLPETTGLHGTLVHQKVFELYQNGKLSKTGPTLHQVSAKYDEGPIIRYFDDVDIRSKDSAESIEQKVRAVERQMIPIGINQYLKEIL